VLNSLPVAKLLEQFIDVWQVVRGHVLYEIPIELVITNAAINPAEENDKLHQGRQRERPPVGIDASVHGRDCERPKNYRTRFDSGYPQ